METIASNGSVWDQNASTKKKLKYYVNESMSHDRSLLPYTPSAEGCRVFCGKGAFQPNRRLDEVWEGSVVRVPLRAFDLFESRH